ncbi:pyrimidine-nucleoside phosphorylase [Halotalea alkalilenta]|uniref:pyrimidine-nucleoside phosphorylase n=1 Tax=Halotalea alkalilenta TaxID=376489 RepID=UPI000486E654|nr:pyrimidine-nucleoside phosphorylase [Halotalea alkalilenta]
MRMVDIIEKKRNGESLSREEIEFFVDGYSRDEIPDYQAAALAMAIYFRDMDDRERADLTLAMANSGDTLDLGEIEGIKVDKHSTGGVGDTTTLVLGPLVAALGVPVAKMSGRGLGHTGGTIDKLESIAGFNVELSSAAFIDQVNRHRLAVIGQSGDLTPADKKLYALRDVTATVDSIPLIASSIMSKKIAAGADAIVLDVKCGEGAFMKSVDDARRLAEAMVRIGNQVGRRTMAVISDMSQPLGRAIGNALEVEEAIQTLRGEGPADLHELCLTLGAQMVVLAGRAANLDEARALLEAAMADGRAIETFRRFVANQGGDASLIDHPERLPRARRQVTVEVPRDGVVARLDAALLGTAVMKLGAGRETKASTIDLATGMVLNAKVGDRVRAGEPLLVLHANQDDLDEVLELVHRAVVVSEHAEPPVLIHELVSA